MVEQLKTVDEVVTALGGNMVVQAITCSKHGSAVSNWKRIGRFPAKTHKVLQSALSERSMSAPDELWGIIHG
jgi:hypothetical protein